MLERENAAVTVRTAITNGMTAPVRRGSAAAVQRPII